MSPAMIHTNARVLLLGLIFCPVNMLGTLYANEETGNGIRFNRDVLPILSENCFACHGFDQSSRAADLRLDQRDGAIADHDGVRAITPGQPEASELIHRITTSDLDLIMPPHESDKRLSPGQIATLRRWIAEGAQYEKHWAFSELTKPAVPEAGDVAHPLDAFVSAKLHKHGLDLAPEADPAVLLRRVTLDLTGLPPTLQELEAFRADLAQPDTTPHECYERVVDRLLQSPHYGEHLAVAWLDAARYADTNGYFGDKPRQMWLWRDWIIDAFNQNLPYDQFTIDQLAGDLLPNPTTPQLIATGFNRNHIANNETGIIAEEFRVEYVVDRVDTTMTTWLGMTAGCAQCHDHKYDPISQREFYQLFAFFNNVPETGIITKNDPPPLIEVPSTEQAQQLATFAAETKAAEAAFLPIRRQLAEELATARFTPPQLPVFSADNASRRLHEPFNGHLSAGVHAIGTPLPFEDGLLGKSASFDGTRHIEAELQRFDLDAPWTIGFWFRANGPLSCPLSRIEPSGNRRGLEFLYSKGELTINLVHRWGVDAIEVSTLQQLPSGVWNHILLSYDGSKTVAGLQLFINGEPAELEVHRDALTGSLRNTEPFRIGRRDSGLGCYGRLDELRILQQSTDLATMRDWYWSEQLVGIHSTPANQRTARDSERLLDFYLAESGREWFIMSVENPCDLMEARATRARLQAARQAEQRLRESIPTVLVMQELEEPRQAYVLERGQYDKPTEPVDPGVPTVIAPWPAGVPSNRLGLARWLVAPENPLTPRVAVNRLWQHCFGEGLVRTVDDFGTQGEQPTHPELLEWLAADFRDTGWDIKRMIKQIVMSHTYRQQSQFRLQNGEIFDPQNRLLARGPSRRLSAEMLRDQALAVSGLLFRKIGGPSVKPYQPDGLWEAVSYNGEESYSQETGSGLWRRSLYTYIKRQAPPPWLLTFDGPTREKCTIRRTSTNTPLQALVLLNDDTYIEASRELASQLLDSTGSDIDRLRELWQTVLIREAETEDIALLAQLLERQRARFKTDSDAAQQLISIGESVPTSNHDPVELATWTVVAHTVLNLDEAITKR